MQVKLYIDNQTVDLDENLDIRLNKEFQNTESLIITDVNYSYEVELPVTLTNRTIFGFPDVVSVQDKFSRVYDAQLYADEVLLLDGKFLINEINSDCYKGNLYVPAKKELSDVLGDRTLKQLKPHYKNVNSFSDIDRINCYVGGITGSDVVLPPADQRDNHVCFPYVLYGWPYNKPEVTTDRYYQTTNFEDTTFTLNNIFPAFNVLSVLKDMFETEGYNLVGNVFDNPKLNGLYQTYSESADLWKTDKMTPYNLSFSCDYTLCRYEQMISANILSETAEEFEEEGFKFWVDNPVWSNNTTFTSMNNKYEMMKRVEAEGYSSSKRVIVIPVSGWYQINSTGTITLPDYNRLEEFPNMKITGWKSRYDDSSFNQSAWEFQIKKGVPKENVNFYGYNFCMPGVPVDYTYTETNPSVIWFGMNILSTLHGYIMPTAVRVMDSESQRRFGKNEKTSLVKNYSGFDVSDFIMGAKWGNQKLIYSDYLKSRRYPKTALMDLYDVSKSPAIYNKPDKFKEDYPDITADYLALYSEFSDFDTTYGYQTAQALVNEEGMANFEGYNVLKANRSGTTTSYTWDSTSNPGAKTYPGQSNNTVISSTNTNGSWNLNNCVWLEEGDTVYTEILGAYNNQHEKNSTSDRQCGCTNARLSFSFSINLVNTSKEWKPTNDDPIRGINDPETPKETDMNQFLPNIKCNDYLNNFLNAFNCRLTMVNENTYSLDFNGKDSIFTNTVPIDNYCNNINASFKRINLPSSISYRFKVDTTEEGYVHGNDSTYQNQPQWLFNQPEHTGALTILNPNNTSGSEKKNECLWSYTWLKTIKLPDGTLIPAPIICDSKLWGESYTYESVQREKFATDKTMRLFYIYNRQRRLGVDSVIPELNYIRITGEHKFRLLIADVNIWNYGYRNGHNYMGEWVTSFIDYDTNRLNTLSGNRTTLTDNFLNLDISAKQYECNVECILPNFVYWDIVKGSKVLFNDSLWDVKSIDGFDVYEREPCELTLLSMNY